MQVSRPSSPNRQRSTRSATSEKIEKLVPAPSKDAPSGRACPGQTVTALIVPLRLRSPDPPYRCCQADAARPMLPDRCCQADAARPCRLLHTQTELPPPITTTSHGFHTANRISLWRRCASVVESVTTRRLNR